MTGIYEHLSELFALPLTKNVALFSVMLGVILIVPLLTQKLRIPHVIGLILCGVAMGPHALGIIDNSGAISLFSTIGILYIMFTQVSSSISTNSSSIEIGVLHLVFDVGSPLDDHISDLSFRIRIRSPGELLSR